jgi:hypothetical protein
MGELSKPGDHAWLKRENDSESAEVLRRVALVATDPEAKGHEAEKSTTYGAEKDNPMQVAVHNRWDRTEDTLKTKGADLEPVFRNDP